MISLLAILGCAVMLLAAWLLSNDRKSIQKSVVLRALLLQASIAALMLYFPWGQSALVAIASGVETVIGYSSSGIDFMFGELGSQKLGFIFAFHVLPIIVFFSSLIAVLYHLNIIQRVVHFVGAAIQRLLGTSQAESCAATANIFIGGTEVYLLMRPYAPKMTRSELFALMVGGATSVSGAVLVGYAGMGVEIKYLIAAVFMSAPGGLLMAKIMVPETGQPENISVAVDYADDHPVNVIEAATNGALSGAKLALAVGAMLLALISLIAFLNGIIGGLGSLFGLTGLTAESILGYLFAPVAFLLGVPWSETVAAGGLLGQKLVLNEFVAFSSFVTVESQLTEHTAIVMTFALCGFANLATPASLLGVLATMIPERRKEIASLAFKVIIAGTLANLLSGAMASFFIALI